MTREDERVRKGGEERHDKRKDRLTGEEKRGLGSSDAFPLLKPVSYEGVSMAAL